MSAERFFGPFFDTVDASSPMRGAILGELAAPHRHWHGFFHHALMLRHIRRGTYDDKSMRRLVLATLFHDIVYDARRTDNEEASAAVARLWPAPVEAEPVATLILATKTHHLDTDPVTCVLLLADLAVLWTPSPKLYAFYAHGIRAEYAHVPDEAYRAGRRAMLEKLREQLSGILDASETVALGRNLSGEMAGLARGEYDLEP